MSSSPTLAELLNAPSAFAHGDKTYQIREPNLLECAEYEQWLAAEARAGAAAATELSDEDRRQLLRDVVADVAARRYGWGGAECVRSLTTPDGIAKLMSIVCRDQGLSYATARKIVDTNLLEIARLLRLAEEEARDDPAKKAELGRLLKSKGLPEDFLSTSRSGSSTSTAPAPSPSSPASAPDS